MVVVSKGCLVRPPCPPADVSGLYRQPPRWEFQGDRPRDGSEQAMFGMIPPGDPDRTTRPAYHGTWALPRAGPVLRFWPLRPILILRRVPFKKDRPPPKERWPSG